MWIRQQNLERADSLSLQVLNSPVAQESHMVAAELAMFVQELLKATSELQGDSVIVPVKLFHSLMFLVQTELEAAEDNSCGEGCILRLEQPLAHDSIDCTVCAFFERFKILSAASVGLNQLRDAYLETIDRLPSQVQNNGK